MQRQHNRPSSPESSENEEMSSPNETVVTITSQWANNSNNADDRNIQKIRSSTEHIKVVPLEMLKHTQGYYHVCCNHEALDNITHIRNFFTMNKLKQREVIIVHKDNLKIIEDGHPKFAVLDVISGEIKEKRMSGKTGYQDQRGFQDYRGEGGFVENVESGCLVKTLKSCFRVRQKHKKPIISQNIGFHRRGSRTFSRKNHQTPRPQHRITLSILSSLHKRNPTQNEHG